MTKLRTAASIAVGIASAGMVVTAVFASKGGAELAIKKTEPTKKDILKAYGPAAVAGAIALAAIGYLGYSTTELGNKLVREIAAHALTVSAGQKAMKALEEKATELIGPKKTRQLVDEHAVAESQAKMDFNDPSLAEEMFEDAVITGNTLFFDVDSARFFWSNSEFIRKMINDLNQELLVGGECDMNDIYDTLGLRRTARGGCFTNKPYRPVDVDLSTSDVLSLCGRETPYLIVRYTGFDWYEYNK